MATSKVSIPVVDIKGKSLGDREASSDLFAIEPNENAVHFVCEGQRYRFYKKNAATKTRSAVSGGGKKARKQKGTGGSRQGGNRGPQWVGGGVVFGPQPLNRHFKINRKISRLALTSLLSDRHSSGQIRILKDGLQGPKTSTVAGLLDGLALKGARVGFVVSSKTDLSLAKSVRNIRNVDLLTEEHWTPLDFVKTDSLIFSESAFDRLTTRLEGKTDGKNEGKSA